MGGCCGGICYDEDENEKLIIENGVDGGGGIRLSSFIKKAEETSKQPFPMHDMVKFEHRPIISYYLMAGRRDERSSWRTVSSLF